MTDFNTEFSNIKPSIRELTLANGMSFPSDTELMMLILGKGTKNNPVSKMAQNVIQVMNSTNKDNFMEELMKIDGIGENRALSIAAGMELGRRRSRYEKSPIKTPMDIIPYMQHFSLEPTEHFILATINGSHEIMDIKVIANGTPSKTSIHPREVFAPAVEQHASAIIVAHNHPSGSVCPSDSDITSTKTLMAAAGILGISFLDHIILGRNDYFSFLEHDML